MTGMPQPLNTFNSEIVKHPITWGVTKLEDHPHFALQILQTIATWSASDQNLAIVITNFLHSDIEIVSEMLRDLRPEAISKAIDTGARFRLNPDHYRLFATSLATTKASRNRRNEFAHHIWGTSEAIPDALILADPKDLNREMVAMTGPIQRGLGVGRTPRYDHGLPWDTSKYYVYRANDLQSTLDDARRAEKIINLLRAMSMINPPFFNQASFDSICVQLEADLQIQQALQLKSKQK